MSPLAQTAGDIPSDCVIGNNDFVQGSHSYTQHYVFGDCDSTLGFPFALGTAHGVYFEDNVINDPSGDMNHFVASA